MKLKNLINTFKENKNNNLATLFYIDNQLCYLTYSNKSYYDCFLGLTDYITFQEYKERNNLEELEESEYREAFDEFIEKYKNKEIKILDISHNHKYIEFKRMAYGYFSDLGELDEI